jgi:SAM-dependent methyltransferase
MDLKAHRELLKKQFALQAKAHSRTARFRHAENVMPLLDLAQPKATDRLLDVACGAGFVVFSFAPHVKSAVGVDLTPEMVELARKAAAERGAANVEFAEGEAEDLRFGPAAFEIVTCRLTFHHFAQPEKALFEMKRVLTPDGRIVLYDFLAPADAKKARSLNEIESARDASHVRTLSEREFQALFRKCGLEAKGKIVTLWKRDFEQWMAFLDPGEAALRKVRRMLLDTVEGNRAGLGVREREGRLTFTHTCAAWLLVPRA